MTDVKYPNRLAGLVDLIKNTVYVLALAEAQTSDLSARLLGFACNGTTIWQLFERV